MKNTKKKLSRKNTRSRTGEPKEYTTNRTSRIFHFTSGSSLFSWTLDALQSNRCLLKFAVFSQFSSFSAHSIVNETECSRYAQVLVQLTEESNGDDKVENRKEEKNVLNTNTSVCGCVQVCLCVRLSVDDRIDRTVIQVHTPRRALVHCACVCACMSKQNHRGLHNSVDCSVRVQFYYILFFFDCLVSVFRFHPFFSSLFCGLFSFSHEARTLFIRRMPTWFDKTVPGAFNYTTRIHSSSV